MTKPAALSASWSQSSRHLAEAELLQAEPGCPFCGGTDRRPVVRLQESPTVDLLACRGCGAASASRMPTAAALRDYYSRYYDAVLGETNVTIDLPQRLGRHIHAHLGSIAGRPEPRILDFGGGEGTVGKIVAGLLREAGASKVQVWVVDYHAGTGRATPGIEVHCRERLDEVSDRRFDVVIASAVLEHLPEPLRALCTLLGALEPGGVFYARTPVMVSLIRALRWVGLRLDFTFPGHLHDLGQAFWDRVLDRLPDARGYELLASRPSIVETTLSGHPFRTLAAHALKSPWTVLGGYWGFVGGWEAFVRRRT